MPIDPFVGSIGLGAGASLFDALFGQDDPNEKFRTAGLEFARQGLGKDAINIPGARAKSIAAAVPKVAEAAPGIARRKGVDTGEGQLALMDLLFKNLQGFDLNVAPGLELANVRAKQGFANILASAPRG